MSTSLSTRALKALRNNKIVLSVLIRGYRVLNMLGVPLQERVYQHLPYRGVVEVACGPQRAFRIQSRGHKTENLLYWAGLTGHEPESMRLWLEHASNSHCVLDIGANAGVYSLAAAAVGSAQIHAFEPLERVRDIVIQNVRLNDFDRISVWGFCVGDKQGDIEMFDPGGDAPTSASASSAFAFEHLGEHQVQRIKVDATTVDAFCKTRGISSVDLVKIDVEGFEPAVLRGMRETISSSRPVILMEVLEPATAEMTELLDDLRQFGYAVERVHEGGGHPDRNLLLVPR